jgi:hypothetical protein
MSMQEHNRHRSKSSKVSAKNDGIQVARSSVVSHEEWLAAREAFLRKEKDFTQRATN